MAIPNPSIRVAVIEDDPGIRQLMEVLLDGSPGFSCVHSFEALEDALPEMVAASPCIILMDIGLPGMSGIEGARLLRERMPDVPVVMFTIHEDEEAVFDSLCAGAVGYLVKGMPPVQLLAAIREAYEGGAPMSPSIARRVVRSFHPSVPNPLSDREREVLQKLVDGESYRTIAESLFISSNTVKAHIKHIYEKLHVHSRAEVVKKAIKNRFFR